MGGCELPWPAGIAAALLLLALLLGATDRSEGVISGTSDGVISERQFSSTSSLPVTSSTSSGQNDPSVNPVASVGQQLGQQPVFNCQPADVVSVGQQLGQPQVFNCQPVKATDDAIQSDLLFVFSGAVIGSLMFVICGCIVICGCRIALLRGRRQGGHQEPILPSKNPAQGPQIEQGAQHASSLPTNRELTPVTLLTVVSFGAYMVQEAIDFWSKQQQQQQPPAPPLHPPSNPQNPQNSQSSWIWNFWRGSTTGGGAVPDGGTGGSKAIEIEVIGGAVGTCISEIESAATV